MTQANELDLLRWLQVLKQRYQKELDQALAPLRLNSSLYYYIVKLAQFGNLKQETIVQLTGVNPSNVTRAIKRLADMNMVYKKENPQDKRGYLISLTKEGELLYPEILKCLKEVNDTILSPLQTDERLNFINGFYKVSGELGANIPNE